MSDGVLMKIRDLRTWFYSREARAFVRAVDGVDLDIRRGRVLGIVGESGSGKSVSMLSVLGLVSAAPGVVSGTVSYGEHEPVNLLAGLDDCVTVTELADGGVRVEKDQRRWTRTRQHNLEPWRGGHIAMIFQNAAAALNPFMSIGSLIEEAIALHCAIDSAAARRERALYWLQKVRMDMPRRRFDQYPHQLSGGLCQRAMIAMALASEPELLIADEPTTGLDATIQARIADLLQEICREFGTTLVIISHDIGVITRLADDVAVMYGGRVVETGAAEQVLDMSRPQRHPYTAGLLAAVPGRIGIDGSGHLPTIGGELPDSLCPPPGCRFHGRCNHELALQGGRCDKQEPPLQDLDSGHRIRCWALQERSR